MTDSEHARVQESFSAYLEGDLEPGQKTSVDQHLERRQA